MVFRRLLAGGWLLLLAGCGEERVPVPALPEEPKRVLVVTQTAGYRHTSIDTVVRVLTALGDRAGTWRIARRADTADEVARLITADSLAGFDGVVFAHTTGTLGFTVAGRQAFYRWVREGGAFIGLHSAADTFHGDSLYLALLRAEFLTHGPQVSVVAVPQDTLHPACRGIPTGGWRVFDEIYEFDHWRRSDVHVLLSLHHHPQTAAPGDYPLAWTSRMGAGRMFYTALGHREDVVGGAVFRDHLAGGIEWALGLKTGDERVGNPVR